MKRYFLTLLFIVLTSMVFGQQVLWTTQKQPQSKYVPMDSVAVYLMEYYDHYKYHLDGTGFTKAGFVNFLGQFLGKGEDTKNMFNWLYAIDTPMVMTVVHNDGLGSIVSVFYINKENVNILGFFDAFEKGAIENKPADRKKFINWVKTLSR